MIKMYSEDENSSSMPVDVKTSGTSVPGVFMSNGIAKTNLNTERKCHIIADSCADFSVQKFAGLGIECICFPYRIDGEEYLDDMYQTTSPEQFYERIQTAQELSTAAVSPGRYFEIFEQALQGGKPVIYVGFTGGLSSAIGNAYMAQEMIKAKYPDAELYVFDNLLPSMSAELLVIEMCKKADEGMYARDLYEWALEARYFIRGVFTLSSFDFLARGGRIPASAAHTSQVLDIKPELSYDLSGSLTLRGVHRGRKRSLKALANFVAERWDKNPNHPIAIGCAGCMSDGKVLESLLRKIPGMEHVEIILSSISPVLGCHVGPGMVGVSFWTSDRREKKSVAGKLTSKVKSLAKDQPRTLCINKEV